MVLFKETVTPTTSEAFFGVAIQPPNTCPLIDGVIYDLKQCLKKISTTTHKFSNFHFNSDCEHCQENPDHFKHQIDHNNGEVSRIEDALQEWQTKVQALIGDVERLRKLCSAYREFGGLIKERIWEFLEDPTVVSLNQKQLEAKRPTDWMKEKDYNIFQDFIETKEMDDGSNYQCANKTTYEESVSLLTEIDGFQLDESYDFKSVFKNLQDLDDWAEGLFEVFKGLTTGSLKLATEIDEKEYVQKRLEKEKEKYLKKWRLFLDVIKNDVVNEFNSFSIENKDKIPEAELRELESKFASERKILSEICQLDITDVDSHRQRFEELFQLSRQNISSISFIVQKLEIDNIHPIGPLNEQLAQFQSRLDGLRFNDVWIF